MANLSNIPKPVIEWKISIGGLINGILIIAGFLWTVAAFTANATTNANAEKATLTALATTVVQLTVTDARQDSRLSVLENDIRYIRESLTRIETNTKKN